MIYQFMVRKSSIEKDVTGLNCTAALLAAEWLLSVPHLLSLYAALSMLYFSTEKCDYRLELPFETAVLRGTTYQILQFSPMLLLSFDWQVNWERRFDIPSGMTQQAWDRYESRIPNHEEKPIAKHCSFTLCLCLKVISPQVWSNELTLNPARRLPAAVLHNAPDWNHIHEAITW